MPNIFSHIDSSFKTGWCLIEDLKKHSFLHSSLDIGLKNAVSMAYPLNSTVLQTFDKYPSLIYQSHYRTVNIKLDQEALKLCRAMEDEGYRALPIPASCSVEPLKGHLSHRMAAMLSGIGWIGKSGLLITPEHSAKVRLITILTDYPLTDILPVQKFACGDCRDCIEICPVKALSENPADIDREKCHKYLNSLIKRGYIEELICGLCIKACRANNSLNPVYTVS